MQKELYRIPEVCERYSISRSNLYRDIKAGKIRVVKRGKSTLLARADIQAWADACLNASKAGAQ
jgi:hypothetical protein